MSACSRERRCHRDRGRRARLVLVVALLGVAAAAPAWADVQAIAESLYAEGRRLMASGDTAKACAKFDESYELATATGALLNLATCNEVLGKSATAWAQFRKVEVAARRDGRADRVRFARQHRARLEPTLSYLTIVASPAQATMGLEISLDDVVLAPAAWNISLPVDPGPHQIVARLPNVQPRLLPVLVKPRDRNARIDVGSPSTAAPDFAGVETRSAPPPSTNGKESQPQRP